MTRTTFVPQHANLCHSVCASTVPGGPPSRLRRALPRSVRRLGLARLVIPAIATGCLFGCAGSGSTVGEQVVPPEASVSPKMDFGKVRTVAIFPVFPCGQISEQQFAEQLVGELTGEIQRRQAQWSAISYRDVISLISKNGLGTGYKNIQADFNTYSGTGGPVVFSAASQEFLRQLASVSGAQAFVIGSYDLGNKQQFVPGNVLVRPHVETVESCTVRLSLYYADGDENWWTATITRSGARKAIIGEIARSLAEYLGKGTLRQL